MASPQVVESLAPLSEIIRSVVSGNSSQHLALFQINRHIELARQQRGITRRDQIAALVLPAVMIATDAAQRLGHLDAEHGFTNNETFDEYCLKRAYAMADNCARQASAPGAANAAIVPA